MYLYGIVKLVSETFAMVSSRLNIRLIATIQIHGWKLLYRRGVIIIQRVLFIFSKFR